VRRWVAIVGIVAGMLALLVAMSTLAAPPAPVPSVAAPPAPVPTWPPAEVSDHGPLPVDPSSPPPTSEPPARATSDAPSEGADTVGTDFLAWVSALLKLATAFGLGAGGTHAYHLTCRRDQLSLSRGPMDFANLRSDLDETRALLREVQPLLEAIQPAPSIPPGPSGSSPRPPKPPDTLTPPDVVPL
jgi:hypothetical protein